jgi:hypothetical protein
MVGKLLLVLLEEPWFQVDFRFVHVSFQVKGFTTGSPSHKVKCSRPMELIKKKCKEKKS